MSPRTKGNGESALVRHRVVVEPVEQREETRHVPSVSREHVADDVVRQLDAPCARMPAKRPGPTRVIEPAQAVHGCRAQSGTQVGERERGVRKRSADADENPGLPHGRRLDQREQRLFPGAITGDRVDVVDANEPAPAKSQNRIDTV